MKWFNLLGLHGLGSEESLPQPLWPYRLGGLVRLRFLGLGFPKYSMKQGIAVVLWLGKELFLVFSCVIDNTWRE